MQRSGKYEDHILGDMLLDVEGTLEGDDVGIWHKSLYPLNRHTDPYEVTRISNKLPAAGLATLAKLMGDLKYKEEREGIMTHVIKKQKIYDFLKSHPGIIALESSYDDGCKYYWDSQLRLMFVYTMDSDIEVVSPSDYVYNELISSNKIAMIRTT